MLPEEEELLRMETVEAALLLQSAAAELELASLKLNVVRFQDRYHAVVGKLFARKAALDAEIARAHASEARGPRPERARENRQGPGHASERETGVAEPEVAGANGRGAQSEASVPTGREADASGPLAGWEGPAPKNETDVGNERRP